MSEWIEFQDLLDQIKKLGPGKPRLTTIFVSPSEYNRLRLSSHVSAHWASRMDIAINGVVIKESEMLYGGMVVPIDQYGNIMEK